MMSSLHPSPGSWLWWVKHVLLLLFTAFFLTFGIETLIGSFHLKNPFEFVMNFFSASFMVLVSLTGILYSAFRIHAFFKFRKIDHGSQ